MRTMRPAGFPFAAVPGMENPKHALLLLAVDPGLNGALIAGGPGSAKSLVARAFSFLLADLGETPWVEVPLGVTDDRLLGALEGSAVVYAFWQNDKGDARTWAGDWLKGNGKTMKENLLREVLESVGHSCYETWNIFEKAGAVAGNCEEITAEHVSLVGGAASVGSTNSFRKAVAAADRDAAHTHAARCLDAGVQPTVLLWMLNRSFRDALRVSGGSGVERLGWRDNIAVGELARRFNESEMCQAISFLYETERGIKTGVLEPELAIELLINELTR